MLYCSLYNTKSSIRAMATSFYFSVRPAWVLAAAGRTSYQRCYHAADQMLLRSLACTNTQTGEYTMLIKSVCFSFKLEQQWCVHGLVIVWWLVYIIVTTEKLISVHCKWYISYSQCLLFIAGMFSKFTSSPWLCIYKVFTENIPFCATHNFKRLTKLNKNFSLC